MKKTLLPLFIAAGLLQNTKAQTFEYLDANNIKARVDTSGLLFKDPVTGDAGFEAPKGSGKHTIKGSHIMIGGKTLSDDLKFAGSDLSMLHDFRPGPFTTTGTATALPGTAFNRVWKISKAEIDYHIANYTAVGYVPAAIISEWPGIGNPLTITGILDNAPYSVFDTFGKMVMNGNINGKATNIDVSSFENGIYLIILNHTGTQKFVIQH
jgi:hypothetical protein